jgi:hypothetical protein
MQETLTPEEKAIFKEKIKNIPDLHATFYDIVREVLTDDEKVTLLSPQFERQDSMA